MTETRGPGRPSVGDVTIKATVPTDLAAAIDASAKEAGESRAAWVRQTLLEAVSRDDDTIRTRILDLQQRAYDAAKDEERIWPPRPDQHYEVTASDDGYDMGAPEADWVVSISAGDVVRVWAAGDVQAEAVIVGATGWAERRVVSDDAQG